MQLASRGLGQDLALLCSLCLGGGGRLWLPISFSKCSRVPVPRPLPELKNRGGQTTDTHQDRLPSCGKKGHFYFVSFLAYSNLAFFCLFF